MESREIQVLLVEDSPEERRLIGLELAEIQEPRFRTQEAGRLSQAEAELRKGRTDVVLLDLSLPDSDGLNGLIRLCQAFPSLPVVVFTGLDDQKLALQALREGGQDFLVKGQSEPGVLKRVLLHAIERKRVDVALNNSRESLREAQRLETLGRLAAKLAHDFNNVLNTILGFSDLLLEDLQGHSAVDDIMEIKKAGERGAALTSSILSFIRRERPTLEALSLNEAVVGISGMLKQLLPKSVVLELELQPELPVALADLSQVEQALVNLVVNARDALPTGGTIKVQTQLREVVADCPPSSLQPRPGQYVAVIVGDNGCGMDASTVDRIFEPFFTTKPRGAGTGLGLSTVVSIARGCGGGIEVESQPGSGTAFMVYFPVPTGATSLRDGLPTRPRLREHIAASGLDMPALIEEREGSPESVLDGPSLNGSDGATEVGGDWRVSKAGMEEHLQHLYHVVSRDFHEPLRMVSSYLGLVKRRGGEKLAGEMVEFIDYAVDGSQRMQGMLDAVLRYSRALSSEPLAEPTSVALVYERVCRGLPAQGEAVRWVGEQPTLLVAPEHFTVILRELLTNSLKFAEPANPSVLVRCQPDGQSWLFTITDNGPGVPEGDIQKCFRLFGRLHGRDEYPGLGVGLTLADCLADKYGATLTLATAPNGGGCASLRWPDGAVLEAKGS